MNLLTQIILSIFSGILGVILTNFFQRRFMLYDLKRDVLIQFVESRYNLQGEEFIKAINKIEAVYARENEVVDAVEEFHKLAISNNVSKEKANRKLYQIYVMMCKNIKIKPMNETTFLMPFNVK